MSRTNTTPSERQDGPPPPAAAHPPPPRGCACQGSHFPTFPATSALPNQSFHQVDVFVFFLHFPPNSQDIEYPFIHLIAFQAFPSSSCPSFPAGHRSFPY